MTAAKVVVKSISRVIAYRSYSVTSIKSDSLWTSENVVISPHKTLEMPTTTLAEHVWQNLDKWADRTAVICGIRNVSYTYHQLYKYSHNLAANLRKLRISDGDVVCIMMQNSPEYVATVLGVLQAGAELTTVNPIYTAHEVHRQLLLSKPKIVIGSQETIKVIKQAFQLAKKEVPVIAVKNVDDNLPEGTISFQQLVEDNNIDLSVLKDVKRKSGDIAILPYSSGTTGLPKGVELTNRNIVVNCIQQDVEGVKHYDDTTNVHQESVMAILPFFHIYGLTIVMLHKLSVGAKLVTLPKFQPNTFLKTVKEQKVSLMYAVPPIILFLGSHPDVRKEDLDSVKSIFSGAAPLPKYDIFKVLERTKHKTQIMQLYGLTETSPLVTAGRPGLTNYTSSGFAISNTELKIVDSDSNVLGPSEVGELLIRGPQVMKGYRDNPEATKASITEDGWFRSGDLASLDYDGTITIADRLKELIKVKGYQVPPAELESVLKEHPKVLDAGVVGVPDPRSGEVPKAFVVLKQGQKADAEDIKNFVKERVAEYKRVKDVMFLESLPKNPSGKLLRRVLKDKFC